MRKMTGSFVERTSISASTMSAAPSLMNSIHGYGSSNSSKLSLNSKSKQSIVVEPVDVVADLLEKAKFYTSLCLGMCAPLSSIIIGQCCIETDHQTFYFSISFSDLHRNISHLISICLFILDTVCGGSGDINNCRRLRSHTGHMHCDRSHVRRRIAKLYVEFVSWGMHNSGY